MGWWNRGREERELALDRALARIYEAQARQLDAQNLQITALSTFLKELSDLSIKKAASALGTRSAQARKALRARARLPERQQSSCPLCVNPLRQDVNVQMIEAHRLHVQQPSLPYENKPGSEDSSPAIEPGNGSAESN